MRLFFFFSVLLNILFIYYFFSDGDSVENVETEPEVEEVQATNDLQRISAEILERERAKIPLRIQEFEKLHGVEIDSFVFTKTTEPYEGYLVTTWDIDEKQKTINLNEEGIAKAERYYKLENLADIENTDINHNINNAIRARFLMHKDEDYIVRDGEVIATGTNRVVPNNDPTAHAEVMAIRSACEKLGTFQLTGCTVYSSCEPCPMCLSALYWAGVKRICYGNTKDDAKAINFDDSFIYDQLELNYADRSIQCDHFMRAEAIRAFKKWAEKEDKVEY